MKEHLNGLNKMDMMVEDIWDKRTKYPQAAPTQVTETKVWIKKFKGDRKPTNLNLFYRQEMASKDFWVK